MSIGPFDNVLLKGLLDGQADIRALLGAEAELGAALRFEAGLARAEAAEGVIPERAGEAIAESIQSFVPDFESLESGAARDGVYVPDLIRQLRAHVSGPAADFVHFGATSQDVADTSLALRLCEIIAGLAADIDRTFSQFDRLDNESGTAPLMGVTRMQDALPFRVADRIAEWRGPLQRHLARLGEIKPRLLAVQFGGAVGTLDKLEGKGDAVRARLAEALGLGLPHGAWHSQRDAIIEFASWLSLVTGSLGKIGQDVALMAYKGDAGLRLSGGGGSSAMPHKHNPVDAEVLVTLARFNATQVSGMHQALVHEMERSGAAWTLEWMLLPQMVTATSSALMRAERLLANIEAIGRP